MRSFTILLGFLAFTSVVYGGIVKEGEKWYRTKIFFAVDDKVTEIYLNGNEVPVSFGLISSNVWATVKDFDLALFPGDELRFDLENYEGIHERDSFGFVAAIHYIDQFGKKRIFVTNENWKCDGAEPILIKKLKDEKGISKIVWTHDKDLSQEGSYIIWGKDSKKASCTFRIPKL